MNPCQFSLSLVLRIRQQVEELIDCMSSNKERGEAYSGNGYGTRRRLLFEAARDQIERSIKGGFFCEAVAIIESVITDRLESRLSWLKGQNIGFWTLGYLINNMRGLETDPEMCHLLTELDHWRKRRNVAVHELVKVEKADLDPDWYKKPSDWQIRMLETKASAEDGYELLKKIYHRVADLNPRHYDRVFGYANGDARRV